jgi:regulator of protease activity HflC (stomatin/prohibitin superfamily)
MNPFCTRKAVSPASELKRQFKVNDKGNPIEIAAVIVWRVVETAEASFEVDNYENFVHVQSESALRNLATSYPYDPTSRGRSRSAAIPKRSRRRSSGRSKSVF